MSLPYNPASNGYTGVESHGSPLSERNFPCGSPIAIPAGRYSQPDFRCWDPVPFFPELAEYPECIDQVGGFEEIQSCEVPQVDAQNTIHSDPLYTSLQENPIYGSEEIQFPPEPLPPPPITNIPVEPVQHIEHSREIVDTSAQGIGVFEEITHARCIDCDQIVDSREKSHTKASCKLIRNHSCDQCSQSFNFQQNLFVHKIVEHLSQVSYVAGTECDFCSTRRKKKAFQRYSAYVAHVKSHVKPDQYFCSSCSEEFSYFTLFQRHRRLAHGATDTEDIPTGFSTEVGFCPQCSSLIAIDQIDTHRLLHQLHSRLGKEKRIPTWKRSAMKANEVPDDPSTIESNENGRGKSRVPKRPPRKTHACPQCKKIFLRPAELKRHSVVHAEVRPKWKCMQCESEFSHKAGLESHKKTVHVDPLNSFVTCKICSQTFVKQSNLNRHIKKQHPIQIEKAVLDCPECSCVFSSHRTLTRHRRAIHGTMYFPSFRCKTCDRTFLRETQLRRHMVIHNADEAQKPFSCNRCHKRFNLKSTLKLHMDVHSRKDVDDPILTNPKCPVCMKHLSSRNALRKHMAVHELNYECSVCFQKFSTLHRLDKHRCVPLTVLPEEVDGQLTELSTTTKRQSLGDVRQPSKNYQCQWCPNSFYSFRAYKEHCSQHRGLRPHLCWTCHKSFRTSELLELHKEVHNRGPIYCEFCPAVLQGRPQYTQHVQARHQPESGVEKHTGVDLTDRAAGAVSAQFPELTGRELAESFFRTRAQSVTQNDVEPAGDPVVPDDRPLRCQVCSHLYDTVAYLVSHWMNCGFDRDHSFSVISCPLCKTSLNGVTVGVEHVKEFHPHIIANIEKQKGRIEPIEQFEEMNERGDDETDDNEDDDDDDDDADYVVGMESKKKKAKVVIREAKPHKCRTCNAAFSRPSDLVRHIYVHTGEKPHVCDTCQRAFRTSSALYAHARTHTKTEAEFPCVVCGSKFFSKGSLVVHLRIHNGEKPMKCRQCDESFRTSADRKQHEITWHGAPGSHICKGTPCSYCSASKRKRLRDQKRAEQKAQAPISGPTAPLIGPPASKTILPVKQIPAVPVKQFIDTAAQITALPANPIKISAGSAFVPLSKGATVQPSDVEYFITARRISHNEYTVTFSKSKPKSIRSKVDTTLNLTASLLLDSASKNSSILLTLSDSQILSISCAGAVKALQSCDTVVMRARPADPVCPSIVELLAPPETVEFVTRCDVCEVDLHTKEASDAHFLSEDHETAQLTLPLPTAVHDAIDHSMMPTAAAPLQRKDERTDFTCKLCGRKFLDMEPLVAHIRLEHERDHPQGITRPVARTAPIH
ncbi:hypothetical protein V3C99_003296 [Haemonchus contortus]